MATFAIKQLIAGPTTAEQQAGYYTELTSAINHGDNSTCGGADFAITLNMRGTKPVVGTATLRFCRNTNTGGIGAGVRVLAELRATLTQFQNIQRVTILNKDGNCFGDESTQNACLNPSQVGYSVKVYFSKHPDSDTASLQVFPVNRISPTLGVATYAIGQLLARPTTSERDQDIFYATHRIAQRRLCLWRRLHDHLELEALGICCEAFVMRDAAPARRP